MSWDSLLKPIVSALLFSIIGMGALAAGFMVVKAMLPFDIRKEIEVDQNTSLGIVIGSFILGLAFIIGMAIHG